MAALPLLLAGPIVRRVTARSVSVWVALSEEADVTLSLWDQAIVAGAEDGVFVKIKRIFVSIPVGKWGGVIGESWLET